MKLFLPKQHGAWAMLIIPFWLGAFVSGVIWQHIPFFAGWILLYLATYPLLLLFKKKKVDYYRKWMFIYLLPSIMLLLVPLIHQPAIILFGAAMVPCFLINMYFSSINKDRAIWNDFSAIIAFCIAGLASSFLSSGEIGMQAIIASISSCAFFIGSTFYVKTMIREKKNASFKWISWGYHLFVLIVCFVTNYWLIALAFLPSLIRAVIFYGKKIAVMKLGIYEIVNAAIFFIVMLGAFSL